jgi:hypothetical protein
VSDLRDGFAGSLGEWGVHRVSQHADHLLEQWNELGCADGDVGAVQAANGGHVEEEKDASI